MVKVVGDEANADVGRGCEQELPPDLLALASAIDPPGIPVFQIPVDRAVEGVDPPRQPRSAQAPFGGQTQLSLVALAEGSAGFEIGRETRPPRDDVDKPRRGVPSVERALRSAQELDALDTLKVEKSDVRARQR